MINDDYEVEPIWDKFDKPKKINSGRKGKDGEREIVNALNKRFDKILSDNPSWGKFARSVGSGNRWGQASLSNNAKLFYSGDIICENFKFVIESKNGYDNIDLFTAFDNNKEIDEFLKQVSDDSQRSGKKPMLVWRKNRKKPIVFITEQIDTKLFSNIMNYNKWFIVLFDDLLRNMPDNFFFEETIKIS